MSTPVPAEGTYRYGLQQSWFASEPLSNWIFMYDHTEYSKSIKIGCTPITDCRYCNPQIHEFPDLYASYNAHHVSVSGLSYNPGAKVKAQDFMDAWEATNNREIISVSFVWTNGYFYGPIGVQATVGLYDKYGSNIGTSTLEDLGNGWYGMKKYTLKFTSIPN